MRTWKELKEKCHKEIRGVEGHELIIITVIALVKISSKLHPHTTIQIQSPETARTIQIKHRKTIRLKQLYIFMKWTLHLSFHFMEPLNLTDFLMGYSTKEIHSHFLFPTFTWFFGISGLISSAYHVNFLQRPLLND